VIPHVRQGLGKHFENDDIDYHLEMAKKYGVKIVLLIITGYPTETLEDYEFTKQWFRDRVQYNDTISRLFLSPATILPGTGLERNMKKYGIITIGKSLLNWQTKQITSEQRNLYQQELVSLCRNELKFNLNEY
jgi:radical SAM superfamily enzyme YgiQ (UPF0313 family)